MVLRRLAGHTANTAPDLTLITQFGGGKTHTLTALYYLVRHGPALGEIDFFQRVEQRIPPEQILQWINDTA